MSFTVLCSMAGIWTHVTWPVQTSNGGVMRYVHTCGPAGITTHYVVSTTQTTYMLILYGLDPTSCDLTRSDQ